MSYQSRAEKILERINELAAISEQDGIVMRTYGSKAAAEAANTVLQWMNHTGLQTRIDNIGNVRGRLVNNTINAKTLIIASHIDTVINAGKYDGPLGVLMGLDLIENIISNKISLPYNIELIAFADEEGVRFHTTYLGSKVVAGLFDKSLLSHTDKDGITLQQVIGTTSGNTDLLSNDAIHDKLLGFFEMHIEQGPVLYESKNPVAIVTAIAGQQRSELTFNGMAGHAGTVPMDMRNDALCCAAECISSIEQFALSHKSDLVATVGKLHISNSASNVIPGIVQCTLDIRSADETRLEYAVTGLKNILTEICEDRSISFEWKPVQETKPVVCDEAMNRLLSQSIVEAGLEVVELVSGAGHDAVPMSAICPVAMMFVRCYKGISHNPLEDVEASDIAAAIEAGDRFLLKIG